MLRQTLKAIDHWLTNLFVFGLLIGGPSLVAYAIGGGKLAMICAGTMMFFAAFLTKNREEFEDNGTTD